MTVNPPSEPLEKLNESRAKRGLGPTRADCSQLSERVDRKPKPPRFRPSPPAAEARGRPRKPTPPRPGVLPRFSAPTRGGRFALLVINDKYDVPAFSKLVARSDEPPSLESVLTSPDIGGST